MKLNNRKDSPEKLMLDRIITGSGSSTRPGSKLMVLLLLLVSATYVVYTLQLISNSRACHVEPFSAVVRRLNDIVNSSQPLIILQSNQTAVIESHSSAPPPPPPETELHHVVFGIAASARLWKQRKEYIKIWYKPDKMRGYVWLEKPVKRLDDETNLPPVRISTDTSKFPYKNIQGHRSAIRISRIVTETLKPGLKDVRWFVMGDDDTVFVAENLIRVLRKYDHSQMYYIGSLSESHLQNIYFSYGMAYGGGGFAVSYPLAVALSKMQDRCIKRYPALYGSDDWMQACMAELGVPLTKELGFHQYDVYGNLFGLLAAHPVAPLVTLHHLDVVEPIFPNMTRVDALKRLQGPAMLDSAGLMQQSICYDKRRKYRRADYTAYAFNTRPVSRHPCQKPFVFYMTTTGVHPITNMTVSRYESHRVAQPECRWKMANPGDLRTVIVYKKPDPYLWDRVSQRLFFLIVANIC
ncbi:hypothetical protein DY000_02061096 [Brassica cretica]|uniref:Uncharacterized protein n=1 Tax=Brassica cretica TaxID=69181 RepID=A0ABQ7AZY7_BRACR|nr:hypothetical protein DY000_02061096 [Brassica cretica]